MKSLLGYNKGMQEEYEIQYYEKDSGKAPISSRKIVLRNKKELL